MQGALHLDKSKLTPPEQQRVGRIMARLNWARQRSTSGQREWFYCRPETAKAGV
jgi:hypothetical protein